MFHCFKIIFSWFRFPASSVFNMLNCAVAFPSPIGGEISVLRHRVPSLSCLTSVPGKLNRRYSASFQAIEKDVFMRLQASSKDNFPTLESTRYAEVVYPEPDTESQLFLVPDSLELKLEDANEPESRESSKVKVKKTSSPVATQRNNLDMMEVIRYPLRTESSEKAMIERNTLVFIVDKRADKDDIKEAMKKLLGVKIKKVNTLMSPDGKKKAFIALSPECNALDVAKKYRVF